MIMDKTGILLSTSANACKYKEANCGAVVLLHIQIFNAA
jgi:hypothetical protein